MSIYLTRKDENIIKKYYIFHWREKIVRKNFQGRGQEIYKLGKKC